MDMEQKDADSLKCNTLRVLINYPNGIKFGDFIGAYYQIHHFHPQLSHYGYRSLRHLLDDMRETVVVKGSQTSEPVMKLIDGLNIGGWLDEIENDGLDSFEEEDSKLKVEEDSRLKVEEDSRLKVEEDSRLKVEKRARRKDAAADLAEVLATVTNLLIEYKSGLKFDKMKTLLLSTIGVDLQTFSIAKGYKDAITFLVDHVPNLIIRHQDDKYVVQLSKDLTVASVPICSILKLYPDGLKLSKLKEAVKKKCGYDLYVFCFLVGYNDIVSCLQEIPELVVKRNSNRNCTVRLKSASFSCSSYGSSPCSSSGSDQPICISNSSNQDESEKKALLNKVMASLTDLLSRYISGLRVKKMKELLLTEEGIDLEKVTFALGYKNMVKFLEQNMPPLILNYKRKRLYSVSIQPLSVPLLKSKGTADPPNSAPVPFRWSSCVSSSSSDSDQTSNKSNQDEPDKRPVLSDVMDLVIALLSNYKNGLRIKKLQDFLLTDEGIDLEKFSIAQGYKDTVEFLEQKMPQLRLTYQVNRDNTLVTQSHSASEGHAQQMQGSTSAVRDLSASDSPCQNIPASIAVIPPEVNNVFHTTQSCLSTMSLNLPSFHESPNTVSVKAKSSSVVRSQQPNPHQPSAKSVTEQILGNSHMTTFQPSTVQDELKQQVARVLARHPNGLSLFQFRIAYSAAFKQHFPVGNASSTKERLLEMPDVVCMKGQGVQVLLFPVSPDVSTAKPGQPASSKVENVAVASNLALVHPVPVTKSTVKTLDSHSIGTPHLGSPEKPVSKDCCISKDQHRSMLLPQCQEQEKTRTSLPGFSDQLSKVEDIPVLPGYFVQDEPAAPRATVMPIPRSHPSFLQYYESIRALENKRNKPFTEFHTHNTPGVVKIMQKNTSPLNGPDPKLRATPFVPHYPAALPTYPQGTVCGENLHPGKSQFTSSTNSKISVPSVDSTPSPPVLVKPEICSPRSTSQSSNTIQPILPVQPPSPSEQRNYNHAIADFDSLSEAQIQSRAAHNFSSPNSSAKSSTPSLPRKSNSFFPPRSQLDHQLQQPNHVRLDDLQSVSSADQRKASLDQVSPAAMYQRTPTYANSLETSSNTESFIACSVGGSLHASSVVTNDSSTLSSVSSRTRAASPSSSQLDFTADTYDEIAYTSTITCKSSPLFSETQVSAQQRQYVRAAATVISNTETTSPTSLSPESTTSSHHQFAYSSSRITTNSSALSSETYAFTQTTETIIASSTKMASSISSLDSTTSIPCQHANVSAKATNTSSVLLKSTACQTPDADFEASLTNDPPSENNLTLSSSEQEDQSSPQQKEQVPVNPNPKTSGKCLIL
ncbi:flocculation protein FLO11-like isoform X2 [Thamnophis elegans]|uniref:flocculation protein FLO11-like isoform X2 n=1 Tax=Thamnophis elegans TaxID=35005 RepID=UPI0013770292|nr:flocculation protein FLO11-like isoform X2 [Thamnophis elegans]